MLRVVRVLQAIYIGYSVCPNLQRKLTSHKQCSLPSVGLSIPPAVTRGLLYRSPKTGLMLCPAVRGMLPNAPHLLAISK